MIGRLRAQVECLLEEGFHQGDGLQVRPVGPLWIWRLFQRAKDTLEQERQVWAGHNPAFMPKVG